MNSLVVCAAHGRRHPPGGHPRRLRLRPVPLPRPGRAVPGHPGHPEVAVRHHPDRALRAARLARPAGLPDRAEPGPDHVPAAVRDLHDAQRVRGGAGRDRGVGPDGRLRQLRRAGPGLLHAVRPGLVTVALFAFLSAWNEFFAPLILLNSTDRFTLPLAVVNLRTASHGAIDYGALEAGVVFMAVPCLVLFLLLQRSYVRGFMSGAVKG